MGMISLKEEKNMYAHTILRINIKFYQLSGKINAYGYDHWRAVWGSPIYLMSNVYQVTSQCGLNASNGLCGEVVATCEPLGNLGVSLMEHFGKIFLGETLFFQNLIQSLCYAKRQFKLCLLFGRNCCKAIAEKFILYHNC